ncbi:MAG: PD40 domain-containing protein [Alphaproteobacteria bacterium]|nr:PD40 domain-containing protein [Alphaproteobacteria bacterium]MCB9792137.1 PD40 domain-containing protein [Alphaproteobacteria bacterium]
MLLIWLAACAPETVPAPEPDVIAEVRVEPGEIQLTTGPERLVQYQFRAIAVDAGGQEQELEVAEWSLSNRSVGEIDETGLFTATDANGGVSWVTARIGGVEDRANLELTFEDYSNPEGLDTSPFVSGQSEPDTFWLYPEDGVNLPRNTPSMTFMWADIGAEAYRLRFRSEVSDVVAYTSATSFTADEETWQTLVATNAGGQLEIELSASVAGVVHAEEPLTVTVNRMDSRGSIIYWSTSAAGLIELPYGDQPHDYLTQAQTGRCVGCHVVSSTGRLAFSYDGGNGPLGLLDVETGASVLGSETPVYGNFKAFSPDGRYLLTTYYGALLLYDGNTGVFIQEIATGGQITHVDWSPNGDRVVLVYTTGHTNDWTMGGGEIAIMEHLGEGQFDAAWTLVPRIDGMNNYYPAFSPDGEWVVFNRSTGDGYDDPDATLYVVKADGSADPIELAAANRAGAGNIYNSWPRWGPLPDDSVFWLAFSSRRAYGNVVSGAPQIWVAGFDPERAEVGEDPSWPAFWLVNQDSGQNNHIPVWVE